MHLPTAGSSGGTKILRWTMKNNHRFNFPPSESLPIHTLSNGLSRSQSPSFLFLHHHNLQTHFFPLQISLCSLLSTLFQIFLLLHFLFPTFFSQLCCFSHHCNSTFWVFFSEYSSFSWWVYCCYNCLWVSPKIGGIEAFYFH